MKWIYKTKFNENGEVNKYKARLVVKGYTHTIRKVTYRDIVLVGAKKICNQNISLVSYLFGLQLLGLSRNYK